MRFGHIDDDVHPWQLGRQWMTSATRLAGRRGTVSLGQVGLRLRCRRIRPVGFELGFVKELALQEVGFRVGAKPLVTGQTHLLEQGLHLARDFGGDLVADLSFELDCQLLTLSAKTGLQLGIGLRR